MEKICLIVGASSGIGFETAKLFIKSGFKVINASRTPCTIKNVENLKFDVVNDSDIIMLENRIDQIGSLDFFIYSAGFSMAAPVEEAKEEDYRYLFDVNYFGALKCTATLLPYLKKKQGSIVFVSSVASTVPIPFDSFYSSSKAALNILCETLNLELRPFKVKVSSIMPRGVKTNFTFKRKILKSVSNNYSLRQSLSVTALGNMEQQGDAPKSVAMDIYKTALKNKCKVFGAGFTAKLMAKLGDNMHGKIMISLLRKIYKI